MTRTAEAIGTGVILSPESHRAQVAPDLIGFGAVLEGCPTCYPLDEIDSYGLGVVLAGHWVLQNPLFGGYGAIETYLPTQQIAVEVVTTSGEEAFDGLRNNLHPRAIAEIFGGIAAVLSSDDTPPSRRTG